jgi:hypothetical protein
VSDQFAFEPVESTLVEYILTYMPDKKAPGTDKNTNPRWQGFSTRQCTMNQFYQKQFADEEYFSKCFENR